MAETKLNLFEKIQKVSMEIMNLEKDMLVGNANYGYKAVSDNQVTLAVKRAEEKYRLLSIPIKQEIVKSEIVRTQVKDGEKLTYADDIKMTVRIIDLDDIEKHIDVESFGKGIDSGDKGFGKASTYARKYALLNAYKIATGEDPDANKSEELKTQTPDEKRKAVVNVCTKDVKILNNITSHFSVGTLDDLTKEQINTIYNQFKSKNLL